MKKEIAFMRSYVAGLNSTVSSSLAPLNELKTGLLNILSSSTRCNVEPMLKAVGQLERLHAPHEPDIVGQRSNTEAWLGLACDKHGDWEQWIQIARVPRSTILPNNGEREVVREQTLMVGCDRHRLHIQWDVDRQPGYIHHATSRYLTTDQYLESLPPPPNCLPALCNGTDSNYGWTIQTAEIMENSDDSFLWYDEHETRRWYRFIFWYDAEIKLTYCLVVDEKHLRDALSGFDEHFTTICERNNKQAAQEDGFIVMRGTIRLDGQYEGKSRTAVIETARLEHDRILTVLGLGKVG